MDAVPPTAEALELAKRRLRASGTAYVHFALAEPGWFRTAFAVPHTMGTFGPGEGVGKSGMGPYQLLNQQLDALTAAGGLAPASRPRSEVAAWSAVHGLSLLLLDGPLRELPPAERDAALARVLDVIERGLSA